MLSEHDGNEITLVLDGPLMAPDEEPRDEFILRNDAGPRADFFHKGNGKIVFIRGRGECVASRGYTRVNKADLFTLGNGWIGKPYTKKI